MGMVLRALKIIFEIQKKRNNEKIIRRKINIPIYKTRIFPFFPL
jgi:hypothetical protein